MGCSILLGFKSGQVRTHSIVTVVIIICVIIIISYGNRTEWNPIQSLIIRQVIREFKIRVYPERLTPGGHVTSLSRHI